MANPRTSHDEIKQDVLTNPQYDEFFAAYQPRVRENFASTYSSQKFLWEWRGADAEADRGYAQGRFHAAAYNRLWDIQRKKLFDLHCRWRAGHLTLPEIACSYDFAAQDAIIENGTLVPPITADELDMYCDFVRLTSDFDDVLDTNGGSWLEPRDWQGYEEMRLYEQEFDQNVPDYQRRGVHAPAWYDFHNMRTGHGMLLGLPDVRGPLELHYRNADAAAYKAKLDARPPTPPPADPRPAHISPYELLDDFVEEFEPPKLQRFRAAYQEAEAREEANRQVEEDFAYLKVFGPDEIVPIEPASDWRVALRRTVQESQRQHLLAYLPEVYEEYLMRLEMGISHPEANEPEFRHGLHRNWGPDQILNGREALGEPRNFDFYGD